MIDITNDVVEIFADLAGDTRWRRVDGGNHRELSRSSEGYENASYARQAAVAYNPGIPVVQRLDETAGEHRLGRHVQHDPASWDYPALRASTVETVAHKRHCAPFDQGDLGSCTGNAMAGLLMTEPFWHRGRTLGEKAAVSLYEYATRHDNIRGVYPPHDTGSTGLAVAKAAKAAGYVRDYRHAFGLQHALEALTVAPVIVGVPWYEGFDRPSSAGGFVHIAGDVRGGHEFELVGVDAEARTVRACNSWGTQYGDNGYFTFSWSDFDQLLHEQGDVTTVTV